MRPCGSSHPHSFPHSPEKPAKREDSRLGVCLLCVCGVCVYSPRLIIVYKADKVDKLDKSAIKMKTKFTESQKRHNGRTVINIAAAAAMDSMDSQAGA